jgi:hypothetical protein
LIIYDFGFLASAHSLIPPTPKLEEGKIVRIDGGIDFSFKQHSMTTNVVFVGLVHGLPISMSYSMSCVIINTEVICFCFHGNKLKFIVPSS